MLQRKIIAALRQNRYGAPNEQPDGCAEMNCHETSDSPLHAVMAANQAVADETLNLGLALTNSVMSFWAQSLGGAPVGGPSSPDRVARRADDAGASASKREPVQSWYRPPYRSPFDPMFWLSPGHPVDHLGDWMRLSTALAIAPFSLPTMPTTPMAAMPALPGLPAAFWLEPLIAWSRMAMPYGTPSAATNRSPLSSKSMSLDKDYGAYRSAGGHAVANVVRDRASGRDAGPTGDAAAFFTWPWQMMMPSLLARG